MGSMSPPQLDSRLELDFAVATAMSGDVLDVGAYRTMSDAQTAAAPIVDATDGRFARVYRVTYNVRTLVGRATFRDSTTVLFDLLANGNYPFTDPASWVTSRPLPWSPHFREGSVICLGEIWSSSKGEILLGHLLNHVAKLLNFDEVARGGGYVGWNAEATAYWKKEMGERPISPGLVYPVPEPRLTHAVSGRATVFRPPQRNAPRQTTFRASNAR